MAKFIFITGGVVSSLGKGIASASLGALLQARGYAVRLRKLDPYLNVDPGTMSPFEHGEVYVTDDGAETDLDLGHYERFTGVSATKNDSVSSGRIYSSVLEKERRGDYLGKTVQVIPHITDEIKDWIARGAEDVDFMLCEIGGTIGDIEGLPFYEATRQFARQLPKGDALFVHLTLVPDIMGETKTKPTQHSVKELQSIGIVPDVLMCRARKKLTQEQIEKISLFCNVRPEAVISAVDLESIYEAPMAFAKVGLDQAVLAAAGISPLPRLKLTQWEEVVKALHESTEEVKVAVVGKYVQHGDAYKSVGEALTHGGLKNHVRVKVKWVDAELLEHEPAEKYLNDVSGIIVPGGFGLRGVEGMINAITYARDNNIPFLGLCYGMHLAVIEACRRVKGYSNAGSEEFDEGNASPKFQHIVYHMKEWVAGDTTEKRSLEDMKGGTMRLGSYTSVLNPSCFAAQAYESETIHERHRHRFEVDTKFIDVIKKGGLEITGWSPDGKLPEIAEAVEHPWFVSVQFHPELKSRPFAPHPLFSAFVAAAKKRSCG